MKKSTKIILISGGVVALIVIIYMVTKKPAPPYNPYANSFSTTSGPAATIAGAVAAQHQQPATNPAMINLYI